MARWERWGREVRREGGRFLVLFKGKGRGVSPRFHLFVSDVNQQKEGAGWVLDFSCVVAGLEKLSLNLTQAVKKVTCNVGVFRTRDCKLTLHEI